MTRRRYLLITGILTTIVGSHAEASSITYQATILGQADTTPSSFGTLSFSSTLNLSNTAQMNYLNYLNSSDQAAFRSGSFDAWAHPASSNPNVGGYYDNESDASLNSSRGWQDNPIAITTNDLGQSVGVAFHIGSPTGFLYDPHTPAPSWQGSAPGAGSFSNTGPAPISEATAINDHGQIVGTSFDMSNNPIAHPFLGSQTFSGTLSQEGSSLALNNSGQVVGWIVDPKGTQHAFLFDGSTVQDLNDLIPGTSHFVLNVATGIDADGRIAGFGTSEDGTVHAFLLTPQSVPEPSTLFFAGFAAIAAIARRRSA